MFVLTILCATNYHLLIITNFTRKKIAWLLCPCIFMCILLSNVYPEPWVHVALAGCCGYAGYNLTSWEEEMLVKVNEKRVQKGLVPITRKTLNPISSILSKED